MVRKAALVALAITAVACANRSPRTSVEAPAPVELAHFWMEPTDLAQRNLLHGPGGEGMAPDPSVPLEFLATDSSGYSRGYDVRSPDGMEWSVKMGPEAQSEVAASRILWALGYHQPPSYYVAKWTITGREAGPRDAARFRPKLPGRKIVAEWSWYENPYVGSQPFQGLVVANLMLNNWDLKTSNNKVYEVDDAAVAVRRMYVVQDLGASLGKTSFPALLNFYPFRQMKQGSRNALEDFESQGFIRKIEGDRVEFYYRGTNPSLIRTVSKRDVIWTSERMARLTDDQWVSVFRAAGYSPEHSQRFVAKIKTKIKEGLALSGA